MSIMHKHVFSACPCHYMLLISVIIFWRSSSYCSFVITDFSKSPLNLSNCSIHWVRYTSLLPGDTPAEVEGPALASRLLSLFFLEKWQIWGVIVRRMPFHLYQMCPGPQLLLCIVYSFQSVLHLASQLLIQPHPV